MKYATSAALAAILVLGVSACSEQGEKKDGQAQGQVSGDALEGTWKADLASSQFEDAPDVYVLKDGSYACSSCNPPLTAVADGKFHPVSDRPYYDSMAITVVDASTVRFDRKKGDRDVGSATWSLSADGNTLTSEFIDKSVATPVTGKGTSSRVGPAPAGAHGVSGSWKANRLDSLSDEGLTFSYDVEGDMIKSTAGDGTSYEARVGGPDAPIKGDTSGLLVSVARPSPNVLVETYKRGGKVVGVSTITVGADGKMSGVSENKVQNSTTRYSATKQ